MRSNRRFDRKVATSSCGSKKRFASWSLITPIRNTTVTALQALSLLNNRLLVRHAELFAARIAAEPLRAGLVGLLAEILFVPVLVLTIIALVISILGIPLLILVPFGIILVGVVMLVGFTGAAYIVGGWALDRFPVRRSLGEGGGRTERSPYPVVATGLIVIAGLTLIGRLFALAVGGFGAPLYVVGYLIEYLAWTVGFGAAILAWLQTRRSPAAPVVPLRRRPRALRRASPGAVRPPGVREGLVRVPAIAGPP